MTLQLTEKEQQDYTLSLVLLNEAVQLLVKNGDLDVHKLTAAIDVVKDEIQSLNHTKDMEIKGLIFKNAKAIQNHYLSLTQNQTTE